MRQMPKTESSSSRTENGRPARGSVVIEMGITEQKNCVKSINFKIPEYARDYKKEYLFIRGIEKEFKYFVDNINDANRGLFEK